MTIVHVNEQDTIDLTFVDANGAPSQAPASVIPTWSVDHPEFATINPAADGRSALVLPVISTFPVGSLTQDVIVTASATMPDGTVLAPGSVTLTLTANNPTGIVLTAQPAVVKV